MYHSSRFAADPEADIEEVVMQYYESHLHAALRNRPMEVDYLRHLAERVFPYILPVGSMNCKYVHCQTKWLYDDNVIVYNEMWQRECASLIILMLLSHHNK